MYSLFGNKWLNLHGGPVWKVEFTGQEADSKRAVDVCYDPNMVIFKFDTLNSRPESTYLLSPPVYFGATLHPVSFLLD